MVKKVAIFLAFAGVVSLAGFFYLQGRPGLALETKFVPSLRSGVPELRKGKPAYRS